MWNWNISTVNCQGSVHSLKVCWHTNTRATRSHVREEPCLKTVDCADGQIGFFREWPHRVRCHWFFPCSFLAVTVSLCALPERIRLLSWWSPGRARSRWWGGAAAGVVPRSSWEPELAQASLLCALWGWMPLSCWGWFFGWSLKQVMCIGGIWNILSAANKKNKQLLVLKPVWVFPLVSMDSIW